MIIDTFRGVSPRTPKHSLARGMATLALNVDLSRGTLRPWLEPKLLTTLSTDALTFHSHGCCYYSWDTCVSVAEWIPDCPRLFLTGNVDYPQVAQIDEETCGLTYYRLGVYTPQTPPLVSYVTVPDKTIDTSIRTYVYTFVNTFDEESAPSHPSTELSVNDGQAVTVSNWGTPPAEYGITKVRIYRSVTGFRTGAEKEQSMTTEWLFVAEIPVSQATYIDQLKDKQLGRAMATRETEEPPSNLQQITAIQTTEVLCGFVDNRIYFSRNGQPHNWPAEYVLTLDENIVHLTTRDGYLYVSTVGHPYIIDGREPCEERPCRNVHMMDSYYPDIACGYSHAAIMTPHGMVYSSPEGLIIFNTAEQPRVLTESIIDGWQWRELRPETVRLAYWRGYLVCITDTVSFFLLLDNATYSATAQTAVMSTITETPIDMEVTNTGELLFLMDDGKLLQWNAGMYYREFKWISAPVFTGVRFWFTAGQIEMKGSVKLTITAEDDEVFSRIVATTHSFRTPRLGNNRIYLIELTGKSEVFFIKLAPSMLALNER